MVFSATRGGALTEVVIPASTSTCLLSLRISYLRLPLYPSDASPATDVLETIYAFVPRREMNVVYSNTYMSSLMSLWGVFKSQILKGAKVIGSLLLVRNYY